MDILIIIAIFYVLPHIFKKVTENNGGKSVFNLEDVDVIKKELSKLKTNINSGEKVKEVKLKEVKVKPKVTQEKIEKSEPKEALAYNLEKKDTLKIKQTDLNAKDAIDVDVLFKDKSELRKAIIMSEVLGKPRALKNN